MVKFIKQINWSGLDTSTIARILVTALAVTNIILRFCGMQQVLIPDDAIYDLVSVLLLVFSTAYSAYKNTNLSEPAQVVQLILDGIKNGNIAIEEVHKFLDSVEITNTEVTNTAQNKETD